MYERLVKTIFRRRKQRFRPKCCYLEHTGLFKSLHTWGGDSKVSVRGEDGLFYLQKCSIWALWAFGHENDLYSFFFIQRLLSTLLKNTITPYAWKLLNHLIVSEMKAAGSCATFIPLIQTTRLHSWGYAPPPTEISYGTNISTVHLHSCNQTWHL